jgi:hypothetical protein
LVGPLPPPSGGMAAQTLQLARLLKESGLRVELVQVNAPYPAHWIERLRGVRAFVRLLPYVGRLWRCAERVDLLGVALLCRASNLGGKSTWPSGRSELQGR